VRRYASFLPAEAVARLFHTVNPIPNIPPTWNMAPTQKAMVVRNHPETGERHLDLLKWGLLPYFTKDPARTRRPINTRAETVQTSGIFRSRQDGQPLAFAGLWEGYKWPGGTVGRGRGRSDDASETGRR
jgi:putative SOS response-associated peptidase YedK